MSDQKTDTAAQDEQPLDDQAEPKVASAGEAAPEKAALEARVATLESMIGSVINSLSTLSNRVSKVVNRLPTDTDDGSPDPSSVAQA